MIDPSGENSSFSKKLPGMQLAIDSTSLGTFKTCPRKYQYEIIEGWRLRGESPHLTFGILLHQAREGYEHAKARGHSHDKCLDKALDFVLKTTWNQELGRPWISDHPAKNRKTLVQTVVWYLDDKAKDDPLETLILSNGKPAVELSFRFDTGIRTGEGEAIIACGHLDRIAKLNELAYVPDIKTSSSAVDARWLKQFSPHNQFSLYSIAGKVAFDIEVHGVIVDGIQVGATFARFQRHLVGRDESTLSEYLRDFSIFAKQMEQMARDQYWPLNDTSCDKFGGCPFRGVCSRSPSSRDKWLASGTDYVKRVWDPLQVRGEV